MKYKVREADKGRRAITIVIYKTIIIKMLIIRAVLIFSIKFSVKNNLIPNLFRFVLLKDKTHTILLLRPCFPVRMEST